ncbi:hypothetical protein SDC9_153099 [bioreactor metagenome]|uniref:Uncharacterized protein n=1 Tax=bioreactor metagenome TaxID=1076179 RepID=A0A645EV04_9ZZZZ
MMEIFLHTIFLKRNTQHIYQYIIETYLTIIMIILIKDEKTKFLFSCLGKYHKIFSTKQSETQKQELEIISAIINFSYIQFRNCCFRAIVENNFS